MKVPRQMLLPAIETAAENLENRVYSIDMERKLRSEMTGYLTAQQELQQTLFNVISITGTVQDDGIYRHVWGELARRQLFRSGRG